MAFHVACPITCRRICFCKLGFPRSLATSKAKDGFLGEIRRLEEFLEDPWRIRVSDGKETVQIAVPRIVAPIPVLPPIPILPPVAGDSVAGDDEAAAASAQAKRSALQRKAAAAMVAAEDFARRFESGDLVDCEGGLAREEQGQSNVNVMCRICFSGENEGSERAKKMLSCKSCSKKYHRNCLKNWAQHRDLFHWSSWTCPSCRICEVCRRTGDPNKFMFCKRCDGAYHCYCQHPSHKNVSSGPYLCPKHTRCHSCDSTVPGNGLSVRWFLGYTCCDACGRLFVKGNYCPVCLKVYRDSESTPMVCCDVCERWVHCQCDDISDEKYLQYQVDGKLQYKCATCRGESYQVTDLEDAVKELWRRKDEADRDLITNLRSAAGLPTQDEIFSISPYSDDDEEEAAIVAKNEFGRSLKLSLKGLAEKSPKKAKDHGKKSGSKGSTKKKGYQASATKLDPGCEAHNDGQLFGYISGRNGLQSRKDEVRDTFSSPIAGSLSHTDEINPNKHKPGMSKQKLVNEVMVKDEDRASRIVRIKSDKSVYVDAVEDNGKLPVKGKKLVINLGARKINVASSPRSDASTGQKDQELLPSNGVEHTSWRRANEKPVMDRLDPTNGDARNDHTGQIKGLKVGSIKLGKFRSSETTTPEQARSEVPAPRAEKVYVRKQSENKLGTQTESKDKDSHGQTQSVLKDAKPLLRLKFKNPSMIDNQNLLATAQDEERSLIKGQRSKRKRPSLEKLSIVGGDVKHGDVVDEIMDANWILKKLGKDAIGKAVEVHQSSDNSWHKGVVASVADGSGTVSVRLDDGRVKYLDLSKQGVRFVSQKQKRSKTSMV